MSGFEIIVGVFCIIGAIAAVIAVVQSRNKKRRALETGNSPQSDQQAASAVLPSKTATSNAPSVIPVPPEPYFAHRYFMPGNFTGRVAERKELTEWFADTKYPMFVYEAIGGMGKSAATWYWLHEDVLKSNAKPDGVIWWSFYEKESRFETFLEKALVYVTQDEEKVKAIPSTYDRMSWLCQLLSKKRYLIILDGAERILRAYAGLGSPYQGDEVPADKKDDCRACVDPNAGTFLQWLTSPDVKTKTLLTSRLFPKEIDGLAGCRHKFLDKMDKVDAVAFFQQQGIAGTRAEIETVCEAYGCHPLSLRLLSGMIRKDPRHACDVATWTKHNPLPDEKQREHHILELAYNALDKKKRKLISELAALRNPMDYDSMVIFKRDFKDQPQFDVALIDLVDRGLLLRDSTTNKYDLHPIIRKYCYDRLRDKQGVHSQLRDYFATVSSKKKEEIESLADLDPVIELYHHTLNSGRYDEACNLLNTRLIPNQLHFRFGAYGLCVELLLQLFPNGEDKLPRMKDESAQAWALAALANTYSIFGQPRKAIPLFEGSNELREKLNDKKNLARGLSNLADHQLETGQIDSAESNLRRCVGIFREVSDKHDESVVHSGLGRLLAHRAKFENSAEELATALEVFEKQQHMQAEGVVWSYRALRSLLMSDHRKALVHAQKARELADARHVEADIIWAEWLLGAAYLANGNVKAAESHLNEALQRDRRINLVEIEGNILLELAKLRHAQKHKRGEILKLANDALAIADRCEYRLQQAEIHNFLAQFYFDTKDKTNARNHAEIAKERAECGYVPALNQAKALLAKL
jgi:tetratricopeptide (TPR) repeat protein